jgi:catechol 2,3-dioxygenase-like lactoylglutathione lyase family enzyme
MPSPRPTMKVVAPVLPVGDIVRAADLYRGLGFTVERYAGAEPYAFAQRDDVQLHLAQAANIDALSSMVSVYLYVDDAEALYAEWSAANLPGHLHRAKPTAYGLLEGGYVDPDGNLLRFGSPLSSDGE